MSSWNSFLPAAVASICIGIFADSKPSQAGESSARRFDSWSPARAEPDPMDAARSPYLKTSYRTGPYYPGWGYSYYRPWYTLPYAYRIHNRPWYRLYHAGYYRYSFHPQWSYRGFYPAYIGTPAILYSAPLGYAPYPYATWGGSCGLSGCYYW
jgi:hypothetical protein